MVPVILRDSQKRRREEKKDRKIERRGESERWEFKQRMTSFGDKEGLGSLCAVWRHSQAAWRKPDGQTDTDNR